MALKFFKAETDERGITLVTFDRPPVNAVSYEVYPEIKELFTTLQASDETRVVVWTSPPNSKAWVGGAELKDFLPLDHDTRLERYAMINDCMPPLANFDRPIIGAINGHSIGVGMLLATYCDLRVTAENCFFASPEIDRGVVAAGGGFYLRVGMPSAKLREMIYTGRRFMASELRDTGFFNYIVPQKEDVLPKAMAIAEMIASKSLPGLRANKICNNAAETMNSEDAYKLAQQYSAKLTAGPDSKEGIKAFLEKRHATYQDK